MMSKVMAPFSLLIMLGMVILRLYEGMDVLYSTEGVTLPSRRKPTETNFPSFKRRGVVLFYHIPKSGGTSIRKFLIHTKMKMARAIYPNELVDLQDRIRTVLEGERNELLFAELHGNIPGIPELHTSIETWRQLSFESGVPFFAFTVVREPVSFHRSYFMHFHGPKCVDEWCEKDIYAINNDNFLTSIQPNHQCRELYHGQREEKKVVPLKPLPEPKQNCEKITRLLGTDWDWVGTTEKMQTITLPLLTKILFQNTTMGQTATRRNFKSHYSKLSNLTESTRSEILRVSEFDAEMYSYWASREAAAATSLGLSP